MSGLIIEGVCATGKTILFKGLTRSKAYMSRQSKIQLNEHLTERIVECIKPTVQQRVDLLSGYVDMFNMIHSNFYNSKFKDTLEIDKKPCYLVERFHLTHSVEAKSFEYFRSIDEKLTALDFKIVMLIMDKEVIKDRLEDTFHRRTTKWYNYVMSFGGLDGACDRYSKMQELLIQYSELTSLPVKIINTTDLEWERYIHTADEFWDISQ